ncbi:hypothetical protein Plhal304r1_c007g0030131 [Plasmopara halstedii]
MYKQIPFQFVTQRSCLMITAAVFVAFFSSVTSRPLYRDSRKNVGRTANVTMLS